MTILKIPSHIATTRPEESGHYECIFKYYYMMVDNNLLVYTRLKPSHLKQVAHKLSNLDEFTIQANHSFTVAESLCERLYGDIGGQVHSLDVCYTDNILNYIRKVEDIDSIII